MDVKALHSLVSDAIWRAEQVQEDGLGSAATEWATVSSLEERLASAIPVSASEGRIARRGAVRAAFKAGDHARGRSLAEHYIAEEGAPASLEEALREILEENTRAAADRSRRGA